MVTARERSRTGEARGADWGPTYDPTRGEGPSHLWGATLKNRVVPFARDFQVSDYGGVCRSNSLGLLIRSTVRVVSRTRPQNRKCFQKKRSPGTRRATDSAISVSYERGRSRANLKPKTERLQR
jgi:hypothetical protein